MLFIHTVTILKKVFILSKEYTVHHGFYSHDFYGHHGFYGHFFGSENADNTPNHAFYGQITVFITTFSALLKCHNNRDV